MSHDPDILVELTRVRTDFDARVIAAALEDRGVRAAVFSRAAAVMQGSLSPGPMVCVSVRREDLERARVLLVEIKRDAAEVDWSEAEALADEAEAGGPRPLELSADAVSRAASRRRRAAGYILLLLVMALVIRLAMQQGRL